MQNISDTLKAACKAAYRIPISKVIVDRILPDWNAGTIDAVFESDGHMASLVTAAGTILVAYGVSGGGLRLCRVTDGQIAAQWQNSQQISATGNYYSGGVALVRDGNTIRLFASDTDAPSFRYWESTDDGQSWSGPTELYTGSAVTNIVATTIEQVFVTPTSLKSIWDMHVIHPDVGDPYWSSFITWPFGGDWRIDKLAGFVHDGIHILVFSGIDYEHARETYDSDLLTLRFNKGNWALPRRIRTSELQRTLSSATYTVALRDIAKVGDLYVMNVRECEVTEWKGYPGWGVSHLVAYTYFSPDGVEWSKRYYCPYAVGETGYGVDFGAGWVVQHSPSADEDFLYAPTDKGVYWSKATALVTDTPHSDMRQDISGYVTSWTIDRPAGTQAATLRMSLRNSDKQFNNHAIVRTGHMVTVEAGYHTTAGDEFATLGKFLIDSLKQQTDIETNEIEITARDYKKLLDYAAEDSFHWFSPNRGVWTFDDILELEQWRQINGIWTVDEANHWLYSETVRGCVAPACDLLENTFFGFKMKMPAGGKRAGTVLRMSDDYRYCYIFAWDIEEDKFYLFRRHDQDPSEWGTAVRTKSNVGLVSGTWYYFYVLMRGPRIYCFYSEAPATEWTLITWDDTSTHYEDIAPLWPGIVALNATQVEGQTPHHIRDSVWFLSLRPGYTALDIIRSLCTKAGLYHVTADYHINDDFMGNTGDPLDSDIWATEGRVGTWDIYQNAAKAGGTGDFVYVRSNVEVDDAIVSTRIRTDTNGAKMGVIVRANAALTSGWFVGVEYSDSTPYAVLYKRTGTGVELSMKWKIPHATLEAMTESYPFSNEENWYDLQVACQGKWLIMWLNQRPVFATYITSLPDKGYVGMWHCGTYGGYFDRYRLPETTTMIDHCYINPGNTVVKLLDQLISVDSVHYRITPSGALHVYQKNITTSVETFQDELWEASLDKSDKEWVSHFRIIGNNCYGDYIDTDLLKHYGYRFQEDTVEWIETSAACVLEAESRVKDLKRLLNQRNWTGRAHVGLERGDIITIINTLDGTNGKFRITDIRFAFEKTEDSIDFSMSIGTEEL